MKRLILLIAVLLSTTIFLAPITKYKDYFVNETNPKVIKIMEKISSQNVKNTKNLDFDLDYDSAIKVGNSKLAKIALGLEDKGYDAFSVIEFTLKNGKKMGGISVLAEDGSYNNFMGIMKSLIGDKAAPGNSLINVAQVKEAEELEVYTIFFDL